MNESYGVQICLCEDGVYRQPYKPGTPECCGRCGRLTPEQWREFVEQSREFPLEWGKDVGGMTLTEAERRFVLRCIDEAETMEDVYSMVELTVKIHLRTLLHELDKYVRGSLGPLGEITTAVSKADVTYWIEMMREELSGGVT